VPTGNRTGKIRISRRDFGGLAGKRVNSIPAAATREILDYAKADSLDALRR